MNLNWYQTFIQSLQDSTNNYWVKEFSYSLENTLSNPKHGHFPQWHQAYQNLPEACTEHYDFNANAIEIGQRDEIAKSEEAQILHSLKELIPWRKGPFNLFGHLIDAEWRSDMKWSRIAPLIPSLQNKTILDVGCGNGYYMLRMLGAGAKQVIGVDPNLLYLSQFYALKKILNGEIDTHLLPISFEDLPNQLNYFDYIFSMGVLYHRRNPVEHLQRLANHIKPNGALILETLIIDSDHSDELIPSDRYAGMRNVWSVPSTQRINEWLEDSGFSQCKVLDQNKTSLNEQRATDWMPNHSLVNFLDPNDSNLTIEGHPAPVRAILFAHRAG